MLKYVFMIYFYYIDFICLFVSGILELVIDKKDNYVFNIDGKRIFYICGN